MLVKYFDCLLETANSEQKSSKTLRTRTILNKLKSFKTRNESSSNDDSVNSENFDYFNECTPMQIKGSNYEQPTVVKIAEETEYKEQITHSNQADSSK